MTPHSPLPGVTCLNENNKRFLKAKYCKIGNLKHLLARCPFMLGSKKEHLGKCKLNNTLNFLRFCNHVNLLGISTNFSIYV